jgi:hypothetical protein
MSLGYLTFDAFSRSPHVKVLPQTLLEWCFIGSYFLFYLTRNFHHFRLLLMFPRASRVEYLILAVYLGQ